MKRALAIASLAFLAATTAHAATPLNRAYTFLDQMMDMYDTGQTLRLVQSYHPTPTFNDGDTSYTYDDCVTIIALLRHGTHGDIVRATVLGDSLIFVQQNDPIKDGRVRNVYLAKHLMDAHGKPNVAPGGEGSATGDMAWAGMAFVRLYHATGKQRFLTAALATANFIYDNTFDMRGRGGFTGGFTSTQSKIKYKSTEHNIDLVGFFTMLAKATGDRKWTHGATHARKFVASMWSGNHFYIGTGDDGVTVNTGDPTPEDVQTWSWLALRDADFAGSLDWALTHLSATSGAFQGLAYQVDDRSGVWFEGTGHAAAAFAARGRHGDNATAAQLIADIETGQTSAPNADGHGIDAASKDGLDTAGGGDKYNAALHVGATAWYCIAKQSGNPFRYVTR